MSSTPRSNGAPTLDGSRGPSTVFAAQLDSAFVRALPYHFARAKGLIAARRVGDTVELWVRPGVTAAAIGSEERRVGKECRSRWSG